MSDLTAVLVAGGTSARMGEDKAFLSFRGRPLWQHQLETLTALRPARVIVSANRTQHFPASDRYRVVVDEQPDRGPLGGLVSCLAAAETPLAMLLAVDLPLLTTAFLRDHLLPLTTPTTGAVFTADSFFQPLAAVYPATTLTLAAAQLAAGQLSLQAFVTAAVDRGLVRAFPLPGEASPLLANLNTPSDLDALA